MKRMLGLLMILALLLSGCGKTICPMEILSDALPYAAIPYVHIYAKGRRDNCSRLTAEKMQSLYGCDIREFAADYAVALTAWDDPTEVHILKAKNETDAAILEKILCERLDKLSSSENWFYREEPDMKTGCVDRRGIYVYLVYCANTGRTVNVILKHI